MAKAKTSFEIYIDHIEDAFSKYSELSNKLKAAAREGVDHTEYMLIAYECDNALKNYRRLCSEFGQFLYLNADCYKKC